MQKALVTGGAGFIGSHVCERLLGEGVQVTSLDNYSTGSKENHIEGVTYVNGHTKDIASLITEKPDIIYHMGEYSRVFTSLEEPELVWDLNIVGTLAVLEFWRMHQCKLVYAGSSTKFTKEREDGVAGKDLAPYTFAKATNVDLVNDYGRWYQLSYAITYFYNVYGPRERGGRDNHGTVIETFRQNVLKGEPHQVASPGTQTRAFTHVNDTVSGILLVGERGEGDGYSISAKEVYSLLEVAKMFGGEIEMLPQTPSTRSTGAEDTSKIESLGWKQTKTLPEYIAECKHG